MFNINPLAGRLLKRWRSILTLPALLLTQAVFAQSNILDYIIDNRTDASVEFGQTTGGSDCHGLTEVTSPRRGGTRAFRHYVRNCGERSEFSTIKTNIGSTYWYGWSYYVPSETVIDRFIIMNQWAAYPTPRNARFPCGANGHVYSIQANGDMLFALQHQGDNTDMACDRYILGNMNNLKGKWIDYVIQAKWTGNTDGFFRLWMRVEGGSWVQKVNYPESGKTGRTWWNDEDRGPYFKMGMYLGEEGWKGASPKVTFSDEFRLGNASAGFDAVAPGGGGGTTPPPTEGKLSVAASAVTASASENSTNTPGKTVDGRLSTRWSASGDGQWIRYDLGSTKTIKYIKAAFYNGSSRRSIFDIQTSNDGINWSNVLTNQQSSGTTNSLETFDFTDTQARYLRYLGHGNSSNAWNSITELEIYGTNTSARVGEEVRVEANPLLVYPNPGAEFTVEVEQEWVGGQLQVLNGLGSALSQQPIKARQTKVDLRRQPAGLYIFRASKLGKSKQIKVYKQ